MTNPPHDAGRKACPNGHDHDAANQERGGIIIYVCGAAWTIWENRWQTICEPHETYSKLGK